MRLRIALSLLPLATGLSVVGLQAQDTPEGGARPGDAATQGAEVQALPADTGEVTLSFERETYTYPQYARRNPFRPLLTAEAGGPRFEQLHLLGIIQADDPTESVALFGVGEMPEVNEEGLADDQEAAAGRKIETFRLRRGDILGNTRVLEIQRLQVTVEVEEFGLTERRTMALPRPNQGGTS